MPASKPMDDLRQKAASLIVDRLMKITVAQAAKDLDVSRQAVYDIKRGKYCPSLSLVQRACEAWDLKFDFRGLLIQKGTFAPASRDITPTEPQMSLDLAEAIRHLDPRSFEVVQTKPMGRALEITIRLTVPAYKTA
jgi:DNA-binding XRE family transcriptional regulator